MTSLFSLGVWRHPVSDILCSLIDLQMPSVHHLGSCWISIIIAMSSKHKLAIIAFCFLQAQNGPELVEMLLHQPLKDWDYRWAPPHPAVWYLDLAVRTDWLSLISHFDVLTCLVSFAGQDPDHEVTSPQNSKRTPLPWSWECHPMPPRVHDYIVLCGSQDLEDAIMVINQLILNESRGDCLKTWYYHIRNGEFPSMVSGGESEKCRGKLSFAETKRWQPRPRNVLRELRLVPICHQGNGNFNL